MRIHVLCLVLLCFYVHYICVVYMYVGRVDYIMEYV